MNNPGEKPVIIYDGQCGFCQRAISFLRSGDQAGFSCISSSDANSGRLLEIYRIPLEIINHSVILIENNQVYTKSEAAIRALQMRGGIWRLFGMVRIIPEFLRNLLYDWIAARRMKL